MNSQIVEVFKIRDKAVREKNRELLLSTQVSEIDRSNTQAYIDAGVLESTVLSEQFDEGFKQWIVFVKEEYKSHTGYLLYKLEEREGKLLIIDIIY